MLLLNSAHSPLDERECIVLIAFALLILGIVAVVAFIVFTFTCIRAHTHINVVCYPPKWTTITSHCVSPNKRLMAQCRRFFIFLHLFLRVAHNFHQLLKEIAQVHTPQKHLTQNVVVFCIEHVSIHRGISVFFCCWCLGAALRRSHSYRLIVFLLPFNLSAFSAMVMAVHGTTTTLNWLVFCFKSAPT